MHAISARGNLLVLKEPGGYQRAGISGSVFPNINADWWAWPKVNQIDVPQGIKR
jgi:hypothetical protein